ncbi:MULTISPECIES: hypothetical protein [unclassified Geodermatophilus]|uniref:hypothetical protein n=1 Tax=unclassified Geodermatophilus TaxID=2637632 RepID=UPI003EEEEFC4
MTTTLSVPLPAPAPAPLAVPAPVEVAARPAPPVRAGTACPVERRALRTGARDVADALTGIAFDAPCCPRRQAELVGFSDRVLRTVRAVAGRADDPALRTACDAVAAAAPLFAACVSAGAPGLARAWSELADLLEEPGAEHRHGPGELLGCEHRFRAAVGSARFAVPWFLDACSPRERVQVVAAAPRAVRLALRLGEDRWLARRAGVRSASH